MILSVQVSGVEGFRGVSLGRMFFTCFGEIGDQICDHRTDGGRQESGPPTRHWLLWSRSLRTRTWLRARSCRRWSQSQAVHGASSSRFPTAVVPRTVIRRVSRVDRDTGAVEHRRMRQRRALRSQGGLGHDS